MPANIRNNDNSSNSNTPLHKSSSSSWFGKKVCSIPSCTLIFAAALIVTAVVLFALRAGNHSAATLSALSHSGLAALYTGGVLFMLGLITHYAIHAKENIARKDSSPPAKSDSIVNVRINPPKNPLLSADTRVKDKFEEKGLFGLPEELMDEVEIWRKYLRGDELRNLQFGAGILLYGNPGNGKSHITRVIAEDILGAEYAELSCGDMNSRWHGETEKAISALFNVPEGKFRVICIDEIEGLICKRADGISGGQDWHDRIVAHFLSTVNGTFTDKPRYLLIGTTNHWRKMDPASLRGGRLDTHIEIKDPDQEGRAKIFAHQLARINISLPEDLTLQELAETLAACTENYSASRIIGYVNKIHKKSFSAREPLTVDWFLAPLLGQQ